MTRDGYSHSIVTFSKTHDDVDWAEIINTAISLDIVVHYYDSWVLAHQKEFMSLFERGGRVRLIIPDPSDKEVMRIVQSGFFPQHSVEYIAGKVTATANNLRDIFDAVGSSDGKLEIYAFAGILHYAAVIADEHQLHFSVYEQFRGQTIGSQVFHVELNQDSRIREYWKNTIDLFIEGSRMI